MLLTWLNSLVLIYLLVFHIKSHWGRITFWAFITKVKTSIIILLLIFEVIAAVRYTFAFETSDTNRSAYASLLIFQQNLQSIILMQICYFVTKKAAHYVEDNEKIRKIMRIVTYVAVVFLAFVTIF